MMSNTTDPNFSKLLTADDVNVLLRRLIELQDVEQSILNTELDYQLDELRQHWQQLHDVESLKNLKDRDNDDLVKYNTEYSEQTATGWLIELFNTLFAKQQVQLVRGDYDPEYFPARDGMPARIEFAHGFFASALHEISHWCIAGNERRQLADFGYWYAPDGRSATQQQKFERLEIKPQALECLFSLACKRPFQVSQDNLFANFDTSTSTFAKDVHQQARKYIAEPQTLPRDAKTLLQALLIIH